MNITQTVDIPDTRLLTIKVPSEVPVGRSNIIIQFPIQKADSLPGGNYNTVEEAMEAAAKDAADPNRKSISQLFGTLPNNTFGDPVAYQRAIRDEWND